MNTNNLTSEDDVVKFMESSLTEEEWVQNAEMVKEANNGYPSFWYKAIMVDGVRKRTAARFGCDDKIRFSSL